ncbi:pyruvate dehydrogenase (acetyl-transferring), homodimeric type [Candidatus Portiera aleyrodidarum]|nr:pyruvate dehydrogenase (acetyl-transferring), homodimeric type [Candidatus Portiera aleyrodidarum]AFT80505.1 Pyruvate dehydrogenase E1 component [Candidatus Portiera aleyrodidarum BT-QVLC]AFT80784.1 Pyruvate dehydrogenase E1 component [Candidatus Portiera aleyrodidarum BT-B-HRs]ASX27328.1 pyruvate dehydrogenase (acetyl-transferring), homodimeric type [Candidatus Portiera aleyrodidarum MED (Bemisia tabaci)]
MKQSYIRKQRTEKENRQRVMDREGMYRVKSLVKNYVKKKYIIKNNILNKDYNDYKNTIPKSCEKRNPGNKYLERKIRSAVRWNTIALIIRANTKNNLGGHISSYMSSCTLYEVGFNHFFRGKNNKFEGDLIYFQGHVAPGIYARSYLESRLTENQLNNFRKEIKGQGLSAYPHPYLMPKYWQFPTVSMGLGPLQAIYQARLMKYMDCRCIQNMKDRKVWAFVGDGECDEVETIGAINVASREKLDNLIFVINCNLQRLDGPVRGNGKIIDELEQIFKGANWNVIKVVWGGDWDMLFEHDKKGILQKCINDTVDGDYQRYQALGGKYTKEQLFGKYKDTASLVKNLSYKEISNLNRGGHDPQKIYAAYYEAVNNSYRKPTVILAHTIKGYGIYKFESSMETHNVKTMDYNALKRFRDKFEIPITNEKIKTNNIPFYKPDEDSPEIKYIHKCRKNLNGYLPKRNESLFVLNIKSLEKTIFEKIVNNIGNRKVSTTMVCVRIINSLMQNKNIGKRIVPILPDEARTFGMETMFSKVGIYSIEGQKYLPMDKEKLIYYKEDKQGQLIEEGINEVGSMSCWIAAATSYANHSYTLIPFYIYYSMFGFQRVGDLAWAAGDLQSRGFLLGGTSGRTTLNGEGLQHQDGQGQVLASIIPSCRSYDPTYSYELAVILQYGLKKMYVNKEKCYYYISLMNEKYLHQKKQNNCKEGIIRGMYLLHQTNKKNNKSKLYKNTSQKKYTKIKHNNRKLQVQLLGSGSILREVEYASDILKNEFNIESNVWSVTSFNELRREAVELDRKNILRCETQIPLKPWITKCLEKYNSPVIASTDYIKLYADQVRAWVPNDYYVLGTDGYGRSDTRKKLRYFFEVDRYFITIISLKSLHNQGIIDMSIIKKALTKYDINTKKINPLTL